MSVMAERLVHGGSEPHQTARGTDRFALSLQSRIVSGAEWDETVAGFDDVCQEQLYAFAASRWPSVQHEPMLFLLDGVVVGGALIMVQPLPLGLSGLAVSKWAPMLKDNAHADAKAIRAAIVEALIAEYADKRGKLLSILPRASIHASNPEYDALVARGFRRGSVLGFPNRYIVNLKLDDAARRKDFPQKWRYHLNKSEKAGLSFEHAGPERLPDFETLYTAMTDRKQFADHSAYETLDPLMKLPPATRPELFFVRHEGELVGGAVIFKAGDQAVYLYGATNDKALPLRAGYFMHWHIIRWLRENTRASWYDLGGTDGFQGLHQFKKGMVGDAGVIRPVPPVANYASNWWTYLLGTSAFVARDGLNNLRRMLAGLRNPKTRATQQRNAGDAAE